MTARSPLPPSAVVAAAVRVEEGRRYSREHFGTTKRDEYVGHQPADEYDRDVDTVVAWVLASVDGSVP